MLQPVNVRAVKLHLNPGGGRSDMDREKTNRRRRGDSHQPPQTRPHTPGEDGLGGRRETRLEPGKLERSYI